MRVSFTAGLVAAVGMSVITGSHIASAASSSAHQTQATTATTSVSNVVAEPAAVGTPITPGGSCVLTSGHAFQYGSVWTCRVVLDESGAGPDQWTAVGPTSCAGPAWTCKTTFSPSSGTVWQKLVWLTIKTAIGNCAGYTLAINTTSGLLDIPVSCGTAPGPSLVADPTNIGLAGDADGWCVLTSGQAYQGGVWTCYVALFSNSTSPIPWIAAGPHCCKTTFSPSHGVAGAGGIWVKIMTVATGCQYALSFKNPGKTVKVPECWG